jgi:hypothetical protein
MSAWAKWLGIALQSLVLGTLLFWAIVELLSITQAARIFRYQGF